MSDWFITDPDCLQCCKPVPAIDPDSYEFVQIIGFPGHLDGKPFWRVASANIDVKTFSDEEISDALAFFSYESMDDFVFQNSPEEDFVYKEDGSIDRENSPSYIIDYQLIAEMLFEIDALPHYLDAEEFDSWNGAVKCIGELTDLDVSGYLEKWRGHFPEKAAHVSSGKGSSLADKIRDAENRVGSAGINGKLPEQSR